MSADFVPQDQDARRCIVEALDESLFVEAGAGTGKTSSLVGRVVALVASGKATLDRLAAITFTEAAASELRDRVREALERAAADGSRGEEERARCRQGVDDLDRASIQTLHSFSRSLLRERPLEVGLPPTFETLDEIAADLAFQEEWGEWLDSALDNPDLQPSLRLALSLGLTLDHLRDVARAFQDDYDLLKDAVFPSAALPEPRDAAALVKDTAELERLCTFAHDPDTDPLAAHVHDVVAVARRLEAMDRTSVSAWRLLAQSLPIKSTKGNQRDWDAD
ncbi:MAG: UvrD-helicase domain-containing protein, partial [Chloroflexota bacterium]|nr:UvrD-helicase domain-containing protein [Chloroflexota bacterium]